MRVACPPIIAPCFYGIDMSTIGELFAPKFLEDGELTEDAQQTMAEQLGADSLRYLPVESIAKAVDIARQPTLPGLHHRQVSDPLRSGTLPDRAEGRRSHRPHV